MLTDRIANEIVKETSSRLHRNVNIMNMNGIIIATKDKSRIGSVHEGAIEVLKSGKTLIIKSEENGTWEGAQPGVNLPIIFQKQMIGVIGITGDPNEIGSIGELVKMTTELMIQQEFMASQIEWKQRTKEMVIDQLLKSDPSMTSINQSLSLLGLKLMAPFSSVIIQITEQSIPNRTLIQKLEEVIGENHAIVGFIHVNQIFLAVYGLEENEIDQRLNSAYKLLKHLHIIFRMAYSLPFQNLKNFKQSYKECEITLNITESQKDFVSFEQIEAKALIYQVDQGLTNRFSHRVLKNFDDNKAKTLESFFHHNLNIQKTADNLFVHRNTLIYRLNKITEETGYDPRSFKDALILQVALWIFQKTEE